MPILKSPLLCTGGNGVHSKAMKSCEREKAPMLYLPGIPVQSAKIALPFPPLVNCNYMYHKEKWTLIRFLHVHVSWLKVLGGSRMIRWTNGPPKGVGAGGGCALSRAKLKVTLISIIVPEKLPMQHY